MSVLINGLDMPKGCLGCPCINAKYNECMILQRRVTNVMTRMTDCPLIELPDHVEHGKWIIVNEHTAKCSLCGAWESTNGSDKTGKGLIFKALKHYCPNCGAKMDGGEDERTD